MRSAGPAGRGDGVTRSSGELSDPRSARRCESISRSPNTIFGRVRHQQSGGRVLHGVVRRRHTRRRHEAIERMSTNGGMVDSVGGGGRAAGGDSTGVHARAEAAHGGDGHHENRRSNFAKMFCRQTFTSRNARARRSPGRYGVTRPCSKNAVSSIASGARRQVESRLRVVGKATTRRFRGRDFASCSIGFAKLRNECGARTVGIRWMIAVLERRVSRERR